MKISYLQSYRTLDLTEAQLMTAAADPTFPCWVAIYCLVDPRTEEIVYVGKTVDPKTRFFSHLERGSYQVARLCNELGSLGLVPQMHVVDVVHESAWKESERLLINMIRSADGDMALLNSTDGGDGLDGQPKSKIDLERVMTCVPWIIDARIDAKPKLQNVDIVSSLNMIRSLKSFKDASVATTVQAKFDSLNTKEQDAVYTFLNRIYDALK